MRKTLLCCLLALLAAPFVGLAAETLKAGGVELKPEELLLTPKKGYMHVLWDSYPAKGRDAAQLAKLDLKAAALDLLVPAQAKDPKLSMAKVDIVEFSELDNYGAPRWDKVKFLARFEAKKKKGKWVIKELPK